MENVSVRAYERILEMIFTKELQAGEKISETALEKRLQMSRTPIRTALITLAQEGLVEMKENCYTRIALISEDYLKQFGVIRTALDIQAIKLAILNGSNAEFDELEACCLEHEAAMERGDDTETCRLDCMFHQKIALIGKNQVLCDIMDSMYKRQMFISVYSDFNASDRKRSLRQHQSILSALKKRDLNFSVEAVKKHLYDFYNLTDKQTML